MKTSSINSSHLVLGGLVTLTLCTGAILTSSRVTANDAVVDDISITVPVACSMGGEIAAGEEHTATLHNGIWSGDSADYANGIGKTTLTTFCNDYNGFAIYAVGFTGETTDSEDNNKLVGATTGQSINTGVYEQGDEDSSWSMKVTKVTDPSKTDTPANMEITNDFDDWHIVPASYTQVASYKAQTGSSATLPEDAGGLGAKVETTYAAYISLAQTPDQYTGKVKYIMVHPYNASVPEDDGYMYIPTSEDEEPANPEDLEILSYHINDNCMTMDDFWLFEDLTPEQRATFCAGGEVTINEEVYSAQSFIDNGEWVELLGEEGEEPLFDSIKIADYPRATSDYGTLNSDVFIKYNKDNFLENYVCTMYNADERDGEPYCINPKDDPEEAVVSLFGQENCLTGEGCKVIEEEAIWACEADNTIGYLMCTVSKSDGGQGAQIDANVYFSFPSPSENYSDLVFYNNEPLPIYGNSLWNSLISSCRDDFCENDGEYDDSRLTFETTSEVSVDVKLKPFSDNDYMVLTSVSTETNAETGEQEVVVGECPGNPEFNYSQFTYHGAPLTDPDVIGNVQDTACRGLMHTMESIPVNCILKIIGE